MRTLSCHPLLCSSRASFSWRQHIYEKSCFLSTDFYMTFLDPSSDLCLGCKSRLGAFRGLLDNATRWFVVPFGVPLKAPQIKLGHYRRVSSLAALPGFCQ